MISDSKVNSCRHLKRPVEQDVQRLPCLVTHLHRAALPDLRLLPGQMHSTLRLQDPLSLKGSLAADGNRSSRMNST